MNPFAASTPPIKYIAPGYQVDLDRLQPRQTTSCRRIFMLLAVFSLFLCGTGFAIFAILRQISMPMDGAVRLTLIPFESEQGSEQQQPTLDDWSATGTALAAATASPTMDYCWHLTPSATPSLTPMPITPDAWALQGTAYAQQTGTPTPLPTATQAPPMAWCNIATMTMTPFVIDVPTATRGASSTPMPTLTPLPTELPMIVLPTDRPAPVVNTGSVGSGYTAPPSAPIVQQAPPMQPVQAQPVVVTVVVVQTAVPTKTQQPTATATMTATLTATSTATPSPTLTPVLTISGVCSMGMVFYQVDYLNPPADWVQTETYFNGMVIAADVWQADQFVTGLPIVHQVPASADGVYRLMVYQYWDTVTPSVFADVICQPVPTATVPATPTLEPTVASEPTLMIPPTEAATDEPND